MKIEYVTRSYAIDETVRRYAKEKLEKVLKFLDDPIEAHVTLDSAGHQAIAEVHVSHRHGTLQARESTEHMLEALSLAIEKAGTQARRARKKLVDRRRRGRRRGDGNGLQWPVDVIARDSLATGGRRVVESSLLTVKPMSIEEAALQLDGSDNQFVVFRDSETDRVSVLYKRRDDNYGLIAPEL